MYIMRIMQSNLLDWLVVLIVFMRRGMKFFMTFLKRPANDN